MREVVSSLESDAQLAGCTISVDAMTGATAYWNAHRIKQAIFILVSNAIKYGPGKPILITLGTHDDKYVLRFEDQGIGIAARDQANVFERFGKAVSSKNFGGFGLGLYAARRIIETHGGLITLESELGHGAKFNIELPMRPPTRARSTEELHHLLVDEIRDYAIFVIDPEGRVLSWNKGAERIKQYEAKEIIGTNFAVFYPEEDQRAGKPKRELKIAASEGRLEDEGWRVKKDGSRFWANVVISPLLEVNGKLLGFSKVTRDLTKRKNSEESTKALNKSLAERIRVRTDELRESEEQFRAIADTIPHLAWIADSEGSIFWYNQRWYEYTGTREEEMKGWGWKSVQDPNLLSEVTEKWLKSIQSGLPFEMEFPLRGADGSYRWFLTRATPVLSAEGNVSRWVGTNTDIEDKRNYAQTQTDAHLELETRVRERTAELENANKEMESFSYSVSHDLRAPLRSIAGFSTRLLEQLGNRLDEEGRDNLGRVIAAAQRMGRRIDDLLNLSRVSRTPLTIVEVDLGELACNVNAELQRVDGRVDVIFEVIGRIAPAKCDSGLIRIVLQNLISNARKFTAKIPAPHIELGQTSIEGRTVYFMRDNGVGFDMKYANKLFGPFQRLHSDEAFEGTGIGLATVKRIMLRQGGEVWAEAKENEGATFYFSLERSMTGKWVS